MMQVVPKWKVTIRFQTRPEMVIWVNDPYIANVCRLVAGMQFCESGIEQPTQIVIGG